MLRLYLYARVRLLAHFCTRDRGCSKHPAFPAPSFFGRNDLQSPGETRRGNVNVCVQPSSQRMDFQGVWIDPGEMLPVISDPSSEVRQAATPKNAVSIKAATSKIIEEKWPTPWPRNQHCTQSHRTSTVCRVGKCSRADLNEVFPRRGECNSVEDAHGLVARECGGVLVIASKDIRREILRCALARRSSMRRIAPE